MANIFNPYRFVAASSGGGNTPDSIEYLLVGGGGSGATSTNSSAGGGGGEVIYVSSHSVSADTTYTLSPGAGGAAPTFDAFGASGNHGLNTSGFGATTSNANAPITPDLYDGGPSSKTIDSTETTYAGGSAGTNGSGGGAGSGADGSDGGSAVGGAGGDGIIVL